ncbi:hypothetical protein [Microlunatus parietis]|uniref:Uncharacterized protein n=1 Tax=Microlunatus parietis TaxID=682979 RepID=A0A7Y9IC74_9ACTN|nr:hypothetical protein [Microlunatus parietis]NYE74231.1 hypothetical protein [Microlunatus parietis]
MSNRRKRKQSQFRRMVGTPTMNLGRDATGRPVLPDGVGTDQAEIERIANDTHTNARAIFSTHPAIGLGSPVTLARNIQAVGPTFVPDPTAEALPVVLFEPEKALMMSDPLNGETSEVQVAGICRQGFTRWPPVATMLKGAPGWSVRRVGKTLELRDEQDGLWAVAELTPDPEWISAAVSQRYVTVVYGPKIGVRTPPSSTGYSESDRKAELAESRKFGMVATAIVEWRG